MADASGLLLLPLSRPLANSQYFVPLSTRRTHLVQNTFVRSQRYSDAGLVPEVVTEQNFSAMLLPEPDKVGLTVFLLWPFEAAKASSMFRVVLTVLSSP